MASGNKFKSVFGTVILIVMSAVVFGCNMPLTNTAATDAAARDVKSIRPDLHAWVARNAIIVAVNQQVTFWAHVKNEGNAVALTSKLKFQIGGGVSIIDVPLLYPGDEFTQQSSIRFNHAGTFLTTATADYDNMIPESDETNNSQQVTTSVMDYGNPDLYIESITYTGTPQVGNVLHFKIMVKNNAQCGLAPATTLQVRFGGETFGTYHSIPELGLNKSWYVTRDWLLTTRGSYAIRAFADVYNDAVEKDESNNAGSIHVRVTD
jgi:subtilase family serine protease